MLLYNGQVEPGPLANARKDKVGIEERAEREKQMTEDDGPSTAIAMHINKRPTRMMKLI